MIVDEAHARNKVAETHATTVDGLRMSVLAGIDLIQHPEVLGPREMPDSLVQMIVERKIICSMLSNTITGDAWKKAMKDRDEAIAKRAEAEKNQKPQRAAHRRRTAPARRRGRRRAADAAA